ncbi:hypothetical protein [Glutamicibacter nicotianae]|uniref:Uncharacterized protein n=1 Tax=Glutamicibacter nicotianae TaxID=37929 RepID=A0ABQ0RLK0_GLUNI|nr:hypothetical protein [Glutamicibacter nicotianae]GEC12702.1 hypothetical protein ANI01nite_19050 [Glutamicibacter nicotianae]
MDGSDLAAWIAAAASTLTLVYMAGQSFKARRDQPVPEIEIRPIGTADYQGKQFRLVEIVNRGSGIAHFYNPLIVHGGDIIVADGFSHPDVLPPGDRQRLMIDSKDFDAAYCTYMTQGPGRARLLTIGWYPLNHFGPLGDIHRQQQSAFQRLKWKRRATLGPAQLVGPKGIFQLIATRRHRGQLDRIPTAQGVDRSGKPLPSTE